MTALPTASQFNDPNTTQAQYRLEIAQLLDFISTLLGTDGTAATARTLLGLGSLPTTFNSRGNYAQSTAYLPNDYVIASNGLAYLNILGYTSSGSGGDPSADTTHWQLQQGVTLGRLQSIGVGNGANILGYQAPGASSATRFADSKLSEVASILDKGASTSAAATVNTAAITAAVAEHPFVHVPEGNFDIATPPSGLQGLYGEGRLFVNGIYLPIPKAPRLSPIARAARLGLVRSLATYGGLCFVGDSITAHYYASAISTHFVNRIQRALNYGISGLGEPSFSDFDDNGAGNANAYGLTYSGSVSFGTAGPVGRSLILASGAAVSLTGAYDTVDCFYTRQSGAGSVVIARNGTAVKTQSAAGATGLDQSTYPSTGSSNASATWTITASGGPVEITGITALSNPTGSERPVLVFRFAKGSQPTGTFAQASVLASIKAQATAYGLTGNRPTFVVDLGTNNAINPATYSTPAQYKADLIKIYNYLQYQIGGYVIPLGLIRPGAGWVYSGSYVFEDYLQALLEACSECRVRPCRLDDIDFDGLGWLQDHLHPNDTGEFAITDRLLTHIADFAAQVDGAAPYNSFTPTITRDGGPLTNAYGAGTAATWQRSGDRIRFTFAVNVTTTNAPANTTDVYHIPLPVPADISVPASAKLSVCGGLTFPAGYTQIGLTVDADSGSARFIGWNPQTGAVTVPNGLINGAKVYGEVEYKAAQ